MKIRAQFKIVQVTPREGKDYPDNQTLAEFDIEVRDDGQAIAVFQHALSQLTAPTIAVEGP